MQLLPRWIANYLQERSLDHWIKTVIVTVPDVSRTLSWAPA